LLSSEKLLSRAFFSAISSTMTITNLQLSLR
jgi:hypothetical protein